MEKSTPLDPHLMIDTLTQAFEQLGINFFAIDRTGLYQHQNASLMVHTQAQRCADKIDPQAWADCQSVMANKTPKLIEETYKDTTFLSVKAPILGINNEAFGVVGIALDMTAKKQAEHALIVAKESAERANQAKTHFLENISHDLRLPLSNILALAEQLLMESPQNSRQTAKVTALLAVSQNLLQSFNEILDYTASQDKSLVQSKPVALAPFCQSIVQLFELAARQANIQLHFKLDKSLPSAILTDRFKLKHGLIHLLSNAIKFTEKGRVTLHVKVCPKNTVPAVLFYVKDTGMGIKPGDQQRIFEPFVRLNPTSQGRYPGIGLGLTKARQLIDALGGRLTVDSRWGKGSCFICAIPLNEVLPEKEQVVTVATAQHSSTATPATPFPLRILVVEDDAIAQMVIRHKLSALSEQVDVAENGQRALEYIKQHDYDFAFMDIGLPDMKGFEVTRRIRAFEKAQGKTPLPIVALTAHELTDRFKQQCLASGMQDAFNKPLMTEQAVILFQRYCVHKLSVPPNGITPASQQPIGHWFKQMCRRSRLTFFAKFPTEARAWLHKTVSQGSE